MTDCISLTIDTDDPEAVLRARSAELRATTAGELLLLIRYPFLQYWLDPAPTIHLSAFYCVVVTGEIRFAVSDDGDKLLAAIEQSKAGGADCFEQVCVDLGLAQFSSAESLPLCSLHIPKPWGQEIWYTGIEQRGVAEAGAGEWLAPLPWVLSALPDALCGRRQRELVLLKILDPLPQEVFGDLYFELHEEKREVYVVTAVDPDAWPDGRGAIRFGFDPAKRSLYASDDEFRQDFLAAVQAYEKTRRLIDEAIDTQRHSESIGINEPVDASRLSTWLQQVPAELRQQEQSERATMDSFSQLRPLSVGDVVKVPCLLPHSLQHGVRTVEFQTPVYERLIVSFAQKVLTQPHWDTTRAAQLMSLETPEQGEFACLQHSDEVLVEQIVEFHDFDVFRVRLQAGATFIPLSVPGYLLIMVIEGQALVGSVRLNPEQAALIPGSLEQAQVVNSGLEPICFLIAQPK